MADIKNNTRAMQNLISAWLCDNSGLLNDLVGSNTLSNIGSVTLGVGKNGDSAVFNGTSNKLQITDAVQNGLDITGDMTIAFWGKRNADGTGYPVSKWKHVSATSFFVYLSIVAGVLNVGDYINTATSGYGYKNFLATGSGANGVYFHIQLSYDASAGTLTVWIDGVQVGSGVGNGLPNSIPNSTASFVIGAYETGAWWNGDLHQVLVYDRTSTQADADYLYNSGDGIAFETPFAATNTYKLTVNASKVSGTHTDFPAYVDLSEMPASFWSIVTNGGGDIRVFSDEALTTELPREIVFCNTAGDTGEMHIKVPSLTTTAVVYVSIDGSSTEPAVDSTFGSEAVWSDYVAVYHLQEAVNNTAGGYADSTSNGNNGTGQSMALTEVDGQLAGKGQDFDGVADQILASDSASLDEPLTNGELTMSAWLKKDAVGGTPQAYPLSRGNDYAFLHGFFADLYEVFATGGVRFNIGSAPNTNWNYVVGTMSNVLNDGDGYLNGVNTSTVETGNLVGSSTEPFSIGSHTAGANYFDGKIDEVRIRADILAGTWITTEYNNQNDAATFWTISELGVSGVKNALFAFGAV